MLAATLQDLKNLGQDFKVLITTTHKENFFIEIKDTSNEIIPILDKKGEPLHYSNLHDIYDVLRKFNIHQAYLIQTIPYDEMCGTDSVEGEPPEMLLEF